MASPIAGGTLSQCLFPPLKHRGNDSLGGACLSNSGAPALAFDVDPWSGSEEAPFAVAVTRAPL